MNILKTMLPSLLPMVKDKLQEVDPLISKMLADIEIDTSSGESRAAYLLICGSDSRATLITAVINDNDTICRIVDQRPAVEFIEQLLQNLK